MNIQRAIVKVRAKLPDGSVKTHPFLIINCKAAQTAESNHYFTGVMLTHSDGHNHFTFNLTKEMIDGRWEESSSKIRLYILVSFNEAEIIKDSFLGYVKPFYFKEIMKRIKDYVLAVDN